MTHSILITPGGRVELPHPNLVLVDRRDGGNLIVSPSREVWERGELSRQELIDWSFLVAATGAAMLEVLPQLEGGCINYWEAGNWALNEMAPPRGPKRAPEFRKVHLHLLGRSRDSIDPAWTWGEAPSFPRFSYRHEWAVGSERLTPAESRDVARTAARLLVERYEGREASIRIGTACERCGHPKVEDAPCV